MKYLKQIILIAAISFAGEILHAVIPLPIPASVYGIILLFTLLQTGIIKTGMIRETASFLIAAMPVMFVPAAVGLMKNWSVVSEHLAAYLVIIFVTTVLVMASAGCVTQLMIIQKEKHRHE